MAKCDLCGATCTKADLLTLRDQYQVAGVSDLCPACNEWASKAKDKMLDAIAPQLRDAITAKKGAPVQWWRRLLR